MEHAKEKSKKTPEMQELLGYHDFKIQRAFFGDVEILNFRDSHGYFVDPDKALAVINKLRLAYEDPEFVEYVRQQIKFDLLLMKGFNFEKYGRYYHRRLYPFLFKEFNQGKRHWSFKCITCGTKVESKKR